MKTAIIIVGHIRTWDKCKDNFIESFNHLNADIFVSTYDLQYNYHIAQRAWARGLTETNLSDDTIKKLFAGMNVKDVDIQKYDKIIDSHQKTQSKMHLNFQSEAHTWLQFKKIIRAFNRVLKYESIYKFKYDSIIKIRPDVCYNLFNCNINNNNVIIDSGNVFPNDVIIATSRNNFLKITKFINNEFKHQQYCDSHLRPPHSLVLRAFTNSNLKIESHNLMKYVVRNAGNQKYPPIT